MELFFDTSAIVPLLLIEPHSPQAMKAWGDTRHAWAWRWLEVETEAALGRRRAPPEAWASWKALSSSIHWLEFEPETLSQLRAFNRPLRLRAADAGHLFMFERIVGIVPEIEMVSFDRELVAATKRLGLSVYA